MKLDPIHLTHDRSCLTPQEINDYINKSLSKEDHFEIENHMLECDLCSDAIEGYILYPNEITSEVSNSSKWFYLAAASLLLCIGSFAIWKYSQTNQNQSLFAEYYQKPDWDVQNRGESENSQYSKSIDLYNQKYFEAALTNFENLITENPEDNRLRLYMGISYLETGNFSRADSELQTVRINSDIYYEEATWYLALLHIKTDNLQEASTFLDELIKLDSSFYKDKAIQLKKDIQQ